MVLFSLKEKSRLYGQCNFKIDADDPFKYKFCDSLKTIVYENLEIFYLQNGLRRILFLEAELLERVLGFVKLKNWDIECTLVHVHT